MGSPPADAAKSLRCATFSEIRAVPEEDQLDRAAGRNYLSVKRLNGSPGVNERRAGPQKRGCRLPWA